MNNRAVGKQDRTSILNELFVAFKLLSRNSTSIRKTASDYTLCISAITLAVLLLIIASAVSNGFRKAMETGLTSFMGEISIRNYNYTYLDNPDTVEKIIRSKKEIVACTPYIMEDAILEKQNRIEYAKTIGVSIKKYFQLVDFEKYLIKSTNSIQDSTISRRHRKLPSICIGAGLAKVLKIDIGDEVVLAALNKLDEINQIPNMIRFAVMGIYNIGIYEYDYTTCIIPLEFSKKIFVQTSPEGFWLRQKDIRNTESLIRELHSELGGYPFRVLDYKETNATLFRWISFQNRISLLLFSLILFTAIGTSLNLLLTISLERWMELGVLRCLGASKGYLFRINTIQGLFIGVIGALIGILLGIVTCWIINRFSLLKLPEEVYIVDAIKVHMNFFEIVILGSLTIVVTILTSCVPAFLSIRINPISLFTNSK